MNSGSMFVRRPHALYHIIVVDLPHPPRLPMSALSPGRPSWLFQHNLVPVRRQQGRRRQVQRQQVQHRNMVCGRWENIYAHRSLKEKRTLARLTSTTASKYSLMMCCRKQNGVYLDYVGLAQAHNKPSKQGCDTRTPKQLSVHSPEGIHRRLCQEMGRARTNIVHSYFQKG